jgi:hypothetical protein
VVQGKAAQECSKEKKQGKACAVTVYSEEKYNSFCRAIRKVCPTPSFTEKIPLFVR